MLKKITKTFNLQNNFVLNCKSFYQNTFILKQKCFSSDIMEEKDLKLEKVIIVRKVTRYEYEKYILKPNLSEYDLKKYLSKKGSDYDFLLLRHQEYAKSLALLKQAFNKRNIKYKIYQRYHMPQAIDWADAVFSLGGDGTFLLAATVVQQPNKPLIGINSDVTRSEGFLCLPKKYSHDFGNTLDHLIKHRFSWFKRQRIRLDIEGDLEESYFNLYDSTRQFILKDISTFEDEGAGSDSSSDDDNDDLGEASSSSLSLSLSSHDHMAAAATSSSAPPLKSHKVKKGERSMKKFQPKPPILSLNEVFMGEKLAARVSYYELSIDGGPKEKQKSSGLMVCPGTGSTSWYFNSNNITKTTVKQVLSIAQQYNCCDNANVEDNENISRIVEHFNNALMFGPEEEKMAYSIRDPQARGVFQVNSESRGFCKSLKVKSRMYDASIVIDGGQCYTFNDGASVDLSIHPQDALLCVKME